MSTTENPDANNNTPRNGNTDRTHHTRAPRRDNGYNRTERTPRDGSGRTRNDYNSNDTRRSDAPYSRTRDSQGRDSSPSFDRGERRGERTQNSGRPQRSSTPHRGSGAPNRGQSWNRDSQRRPANNSRNASPEAFRPRHDDPPLDDSIQVTHLHPDILKELGTLNGPGGELVAKHLVATLHYMDVNPAEGWKHAQAALRRGQRIPVVREIVGTAAYIAGQYEDAARHLRTARRLNGSHEYSAMIADSERGMGRPAKALEVIEEAKPFANNAIQFELLLVEAGARIDLGQADTAVLLLDIAELNRPDSPQFPRLCSAFADALDAAGRTDEAQQWREKIGDDFETLAVAEPDEVEEELVPRNAGRILSDPDPAQVERERTQRRPDGRSDSRDGSNRRERYSRTERGHSPHRGGAGRTSSSDRRGMGRTNGADRSGAGRTNSPERDRRDERASRPYNRDSQNDQYRSGRSESPRGTQRPQGGNRGPRRDHGPSAR